MRIGRTLALSLCAACSPGPSPHGGPDAATDVSPGDAFIPTETHALGMNDVTLLLQLPGAPYYAPTLVAMTGFTGGSELVPHNLFDQLVTNPGDVGHAY